MKTRILKSGRWLASILLTLLILSGIGPMRTFIENNAEQLTMVVIIIFVVAIIKLTVIDPLFSRKNDNTASKMVNPDSEPE